MTGLTEAILKSGAAAMSHRPHELTATLARGSSALVCSGCDEPNAMELGLAVLRKELDRRMHSRASVTVVSDSFPLLVSLSARPTTMNDDMLRRV
uniref:Uncharacterized protein n=1 Tax=Leishmania guyanensis TaxID=5670 RepID=A0A1E1J1E1_LEIGU|nr:Putative uncharacterized protein TCIL3000_0_28760 [Leishmania guyanensis]CCM16571.1 Putative uncharacterized protein TCIL3000_0_28760 [Leishmania guyanensis]